MDSGQCQVCILHYFVVKIQESVNGFLKGYTSVSIGFQMALLFFTPGNFTLHVLHEIN